MENRTALWSPFRVLPAGQHGRLQIFIFHRVLAQFDPLLPDEPDAALFERQCSWIARHFRVLRLSEAAELLKAGRLPPAAACITFDDGYRDNLEVAAPILQRYGLSATFFIATGYTDGGRMWNDSVIEAFRHFPAGAWNGMRFGLGNYVLGAPESRIAAYHNAIGCLKHLPFDDRQQVADALAAEAGVQDGAAPMMSRAELRALRAHGMDIGAHTRRHPILTSLTDAQAETEIAGSFSDLAEWLKETPTLFAYPNGVPFKDYSRRDIEIVRRLGFQAAVSTAWGCSGSRDDPFQLRRFTPWDRNPMRFVARCLVNRLTSPISLVGSA